MSLVLEFDDLHWKLPENCIESIRTLVEAVPNIKLNFFTVPQHSFIPLHSNPTWCAEIRNLIQQGNIKLAVHGLTHSELEFKIDDKNLINDKLATAESLFDKANLPYTKIFKGPHWGITQTVYDVLLSRGYLAVYSHDTYKNLSSVLKTIFYNWNLKDNPPTNIDTIIAHGHNLNVCGNGIQDSTAKIIDFINKNNPTLKFVDEV